MFMLHFVFYIIKEYLKKRIVYFTLFGKKLVESGGFCSPMQWN
jgi:hypothetical protein